MKILLVDDEPILAEEITAFLEWKGHAVTACHNGEEAWNLFRKEPQFFDVLITDIKMPILDGLGLLKQLREGHHDIPTILMTGHGELAASIAALRLGAFDFLLKPFEPHYLELALLKLETLISKAKPSFEFSSQVYQIQLSIPTHTRLVFPIIQYLTPLYYNICLRQNIQVSRLDLCLHEALMNAMIHGNLEIDSALKDKDWDAFEKLVDDRENDPSFAEKQVFISYQRSAERLVFEIIDQGKGFNLQDLPDPEDPSMLLARGRGILLIRTYMDEVTWNETGNGITMKKYIHA